ncbi:MAG: tetratricopeptide repeat protein [Thermoleophilaceae bacterium]
MLFDLQGKRRRLVQVVYLMLAVLMGGGLVLFGIGGDVSGGLFDAFGDRSGSSDGSGLVEERIERNEERLKSSPRNAQARKELVRDYFQLANARTVDAQTGYPDEAKDDLRSSARNWNAYLALEPEKPDTSLARLMLQVYDPLALDQPGEALEVAQLIAENEEDSQAYLGLVQYAALAGNTRVADLAGQRAIDLAPKRRRKAVRADVELVKAQAAAQNQTQGGQPGAPTPGGATPGAPAPQAPPPASQAP